MLYSLAFYFVDVQQLASVIGSRDFSIIDRIRKNYSNRWRGSDYVANGELDSERSLRAILSGKLSHEHAGDLNRGLELVCFDIGEHVPIPTFEDFHTVFLDELKIADELLNTRLPFAFPFKPEECCACYLANGRCKDGERLLAIPDHNERLINAARVEYVELVESAGLEERDIVAFYG